MNNSIAADLNGTIPVGMSFNVRLQNVPVRPGVQPANLPGGQSLPPEVRADFTHNGWVRCYKWNRGRMSPIAGNTNFGPAVKVSEVTVFTGATTSNFSAVAFDVTAMDVLGNGGWRQISFDRKQTGTSKRDFAYVSTAGQYRKIQGKRTVRQLFPQCYDYGDWDSDNNFIDTDRRNCGFVGDMATLIAMGVFSTDTHHLPNVMGHSFRRNTWEPHDYPSGQNAPSRGLLVSIYLDGSAGSTVNRIRNLENGRYGPFYRTTDTSSN